jgi:hypothetical protein
MLSKHTMHLKSEYNHPRYNEANLDKLFGDLKATEMIKYGHTPEYVRA